MPARSNEFQRLVRVVEKHFAHRGVTVVESAMLLDRLTGERREVDVFISRRGWIRRVATSIECMDRTRPADVTWVEAMWGKHRSLPTTHLMLASRAGFYRPAMVKAAALGITLLDYSNGMPADFEAMIIGSGGEIWVKQPEIDPTRSVVELAFQTSQSGAWKEVAPGTVISSATGSDLMRAFDLVLAELRPRLASIREESPFTELDVAQRHSVQAEVPRDVRPIFVIDIETNEYFEVVAFRAQVHITVSSRRVEIAEAMVDGVPTAWGRFGFDGSDELIVINEVPGHDPRITVTEHPGGW